MKKCLIPVLAIIMCLNLCSCGKSEAAQNVDNLISSIGEVTLDSEVKIIEAEKAVDALEDKDSKQLENLATLEAARSTYDTLVLEAEAAEIDAAINNIPEVSIENKDAIAKVRKMYDSSSKEVKDLVSNYADLESAENQLNELLIAEVEAIIDNIGDVTVEDEELIESAHKMFDALSPENASKVSNTAALDAADDALADAKQKQAQALLSKMTLEEDKVRGLKFYTHKAEPYYADTRCFVLPYIGQEKSRSWLCAKYHYTNDDWVFFESITFAVDDERYYKFFSYGESVRDNDGGEVWEYVNTANVTESDIEMFWAIANSTETIVRFQGDEYHYDFTVSAKDKQAIRDVLTAYEALQ